MMEHNRKMSASSSFNRYNMDRIDREVKELLKGDDAMERIYRSIEGLTSVGTAILQSESDPQKRNWTELMVDEEGNPLKPAVKTQLKNALGQNMIESIRKAIRGTSSQHGGAEELDAINQNRKNVANMMGVEPEKLNELREGTDDVTHYDPEKATGVDEFYMSFMKKLDGINETMNQFASKYGISRIEQEYDLDKDFRLIPTPIASLISTGVGKINPLWYEDTKEVLDKIRVPFRLIVTAVYLFLDMTRIAISVQGSESQRKTLTIAVTLIEFLRGDWKKAILSFTGYYGTAPMMLGYFAKIYLSMFRMLSPTLQDQITYGVLDASKSFIIGILLSIFKIAAPQETRLAVIGVFSKIAEKKAAIDGVLEGEGLMPRPAYLSPSFEDFNNLQALMDDPEFICSCEYESLLEQVDKSSIIHFILELLRIPVSKEYRKKYTCAATPECKPFLKAIVDKATPATSPPTYNEEVEKKEESNSTDVADLSPVDPTSSENQETPSSENVSTSNTVPSAETPTAEVPSNTTPQQGGRRKHRTLRISRK